MSGAVRVANTKPFGPECGAARSFAEIAAALGCSERSVYYAYKSGLAKLHHDPLLRRVFEQMQGGEL